MKDISSRSCRRNVWAGSHIVLSSTMADAESLHINAEARSGVISKTGGKIGGSKQETYITIPCHKSYPCYIRMLYQNYINVPLAVPPHPWRKLEETRGNQWKPMETSGNQWKPKTPRGAGVIFYSAKIDLPPSLKRAYISQALTKPRGAYNTTRQRQNSDG